MSIKITAYEAVCNLGLNINEIFNRALNGENNHFAIDETMIKNCSLRLGKIIRDFPEINDVNYNIRCNKLINHVLNNLEKQISNLFEAYSAEDVAVIVATTNSGVDEFENSRIKFHSELGNPALFVKEKFNLKNVAITVSTACSSGTKAFSIARNYLNTGVAKACIVIGVDSIAKVPLYGFSSLEILTDKPTNPFSENYTGINIGEACTCFILEKGSSCRGIVIKGIGENTDVFHSTTPDPEAKEVKSAIKNALKDANLSPKEIDYINLHGTGTFANDVMEAKAVNEIFGSNMPSSSTKPLTGHCLGAAASIEAALCCHLLNNFNGKMFPHIYDGCYNKQLNLIKLVGEKDVYKKCKNCISNSFGFGGTNAIIVLGKENE